MAHGEGAYTGQRRGTFQEYDNDGIDCKEESGATHNYGGVQECRVYDKDGNLKRVHTQKELRKKILDKFIFHDTIDANDRFVSPGGGKRMTSFPTKKAPNRFIRFPRDMVKEKEDGLHNSVQEESEGA